MLTERHQAAYKTFYESTSSNQFLDSRTELLVGLAAAMALNCIPCQRYYLDRGREGRGYHQGRNLGSPRKGDGRVRRPKAPSVRRDM